MLKRAAGIKKSVQTFSGFNVNARGSLSLRPSGRPIHTEQKPQYLVS